MPAEWPIAALPGGKRQNRASALAAAGSWRLETIVQDLFLAPEARLTEQERALMMAMLHGLIERIVVELRARLSPDAAAAVEVSTSDLIADLIRAKLLQNEQLVSLLLRRADVQRLASAGRGGRSTLQRWTASKDADVAAAAMTLVSARGRGRDRFGRIALDLSDLSAPLASHLVNAVAAALALRCPEVIDVAMCEAARVLLSERAETFSPEELEAALVQALGSDSRQAPGLLAGLAEEGEVPLLAAILAAEAGIPGDEAWSALLGGPESIALLLGLAGLPRSEAAALLAAASPALGIGDPSRAIDAFDEISAEELEEARAEFALAAAYRNARRMLSRHG